MPHWTDDDTSYLPDGWNEAITAPSLQHDWVFQIDSNGWTGLDLIDMTPLNRGSNPQDSFYSIGEMELTFFDACTGNGGFSLYDLISPWENTQDEHTLKIWSQLNGDIALQYLHGRWTIIGVEKVNSKVTKMLVRSREDALERNMASTSLDYKLSKLAIPGNTGKVVDTVTFLNTPPRPPIPIQRWIMWWVTSNTYELYSDLWGYMGTGTNGSVDTFYAPPGNVDVVIIDTTSLLSVTVRLGTRVEFISKYEKRDSIDDIMSDMIAMAAIPGGLSISQIERSDYYAQVFRPKMVFEDAIDIHRAIRVLAEHCGAHYQIDNLGAIGLYMMHGRRGPNHYYPYPSWLEIGVNDVLGEGTSHRPNPQLDISNVLVRFTDEDNQYSTAGFPSTLNNNRTMLLQFDNCRRGDAEVIAEYIYKIFKTPRRVYGFKMKARGISLEPMETYKLTLTEPPLAAVPVFIFSKSVSKGLDEISFQALDVSDLFDDEFFLSGVSDFTTGDHLW
jgi:hypothetical protein